MSTLAEDLFRAATRGDLQGVRSCLAAGADPDSAAPGPPGLLSRLRTGSALHAAAGRGHTACVQALLAAGADPNLGDSRDCGPLHAAALSGRPACVAALLAGGAAADSSSLAGAVARHGLSAADMAASAACVQQLLAAGARPAAPGPLAWATVHTAAYSGNAPALRLLLAAQPDAALFRTSEGQTPLGLALSGRHPAAALCLLQHSVLPPPREVLSLLQQRQGPYINWLPPLYDALAARQPMTAAEWALVPTPCDGLGAALPAVLERLTAEAALLVQHLPSADRQRLQTAVLCLSRTQQKLRLALPAPLVWRMLALAAFWILPVWLLRRQVCCLHGHGGHKGGIGLPPPASLFSLRQPLAWQGMRGSPPLRSACAARLSRRCFMPHDRRRSAVCQPLPAQPDALHLDACLL
ncbi:hypothetical protein ABPG75_009207 [Micractinium tetrahymenae]